MRNFNSKSITDNLIGADKTVDVFAHKLASGLEHQEWDHGENVAWVAGEYYLWAPGLGRFEAGYKPFLRGKNSKYLQDF